RDLLVQRAVAREIENRGGGFVVVVATHHFPNIPPIPLPMLSSVSPTLLAAPSAAPPTVPTMPEDSFAAAAAAPQSSPDAMEPDPALMSGRSAPTPPVSAAPPTAVATPVTTPVRSRPAEGDVSGPDRRTGKARL